VAYRLRILSSSEALGFAHMTFPIYRSAIGNGALAVGAYSGDIPAGLALVMPSADRKKAELLSLYVDGPQRLRGMGSMLLNHVETALRRAGIAFIHTSWSENLSGAPAFQSVLAKCDWSEPQKRMLVMRGDMSGAFGDGMRKKGPRYESRDCLPRQYELSLWGDMTKADRAFILSKEGKPHWYARRANPFREERIVVPTNSLILRKDGEIVGWLVVHRTAPDTLRFTDVFIREDLKRVGAVSIAMVSHGFWLQMIEGTPKLTMALERNNKPLVRMCETRLGDMGGLSWTWGAKKEYG